jgi:Fe-S-cluster containining protein
MLPAEAKAVAKALSMPYPAFLKKKCVLAAHLYPKQSGEGRLSLNSEMLPKKVFEFCEKNLDFMPGHFLVLPFMSPARNKKGECVLLKKGKCIVHSKAPRICKLFPFIAASSKTLSEVYPFCPELKQPKHENLKCVVDENHKKKIDTYFSAIEKKGFSSQWLALPKKAVLLLEGEKEIPITQKEFLQLIKPFK